jgi:molybdopterin-guanine dinucleotide biosynthesis protein A
VRVLDALTAADPRVVVGPPGLAALLPAGVRLTQESPAGSGPVAAVHAGVRLLDAGVDRVSVVSADLPFLTATVVSGLSAALAVGADVAVLVDGADRPQWLCAVWRRASLDRRLAAVGDPDGVRVRDLVGDAAVHKLALSAGAGPPPWLDCDTADDLRRAEEWMTQ